MMEPAAAEPAVQDAAPAAPAPAAPAAPAPAAPAAPAPAAPPPMAPAPGGASRTQDPEPGDMARPDGAPPAISPDAPATVHWTKSSTAEMRAMRVDKNSVQYRMAEARERGYDPTNRRSMRLYLAEKRREAEEELEEMRRKKASAEVMKRIRVAEKNQKIRVGARSMGGRR